MISDLLQSSVGLTRVTVSFDLKRVCVAYTYRIESSEIWISRLIPKRTTLDPKVEAKNVELLFGSWYQKERQKNVVDCTLGPTYNEEKDVQETARTKLVLVVTEL